jgi:hypothetical protein
MMRLRRWTAVAAVLGVLLHALALVRHHGIMLDAQLLEQALASGVSFCLGDADTASSHAGLPGIPKPSDAQSGCPICTGHAPAVALVASDFLTVPLRFAMPARWHEPERIVLASPHAVCPLPRGPPASALSA